MKDFEIEFRIDGKHVASSYLQVIDGRLSTELAEEEFYAVLRKNERSLIAQAEDEEKSAIVDVLNKEDEERLREAHAKDYHGTDDDMSDAFEDWLEGLSVAELKEIIKK